MDTKNLTLEDLKRSVFRRCLIEDIIIEDLRRKMIVYCSEIHCRFRNPETNICQHPADKIILRSESVIVGTSLICESALDEYKSPNRFV